MCNNDQVGTSALRAPGAQTATEWAKFGLWALRLAKQGKFLSSEGQFGPSTGPVRAGQTDPRSAVLDVADGLALFTGVDQPLSADREGPCATAVDCAGSAVSIAAATTEAYGREDGCSLMPPPLPPRSGLCRGTGP